MNKTFTQQSCNQLAKTILAAVLLCLSLLLSPGAANAVGKPGPVAIQVKNIRCYPNPATSFVNLDMPAEYVNKSFSLQVFSFTGKKMYETNVTNPKLTITFSNEFYRGIYIYQLRDANARIIETGKFQVNR
jgi:type IX secretion system substrate protein